MKSIIKALRKNWAKYLIEALVITFSIIGAFILDNWNEERKNFLKIWMRLPETSALMKMS